MAGGGQRGEVRHRRARHEGATRSGRQPENVQQPAQRDLFQTAATGEATNSPAFWSHAPASQLAASVAGSAPPMTNPK